MKRIALFCDGTWSDPASDTNVYKLYRAIPTTGDQVAIYDDGVGSDGTPLHKLFGGAFGDGISQKIKDGYAQIAHLADPEDEIFLFGFSRGAYTARAIAQMICQVGLPATVSTETLSAAWSSFRLGLLRPFRCQIDKIKFLGCWDTVGALGLGALTGKSDPLMTFFPPEDLHPNIQSAVQALAIDERRAEFVPMPWNDPRTRQAWFAGCHGDVGGGESQDHLSRISLNWMARAATEAGLNTSLPAAIVPPPEFALGQINESWTAAWGFPRSRTIPVGSTLANTVKLRCLHDPAYRPRNLVLSDGAPSCSYATDPAVAL